MSENMGGIERAIEAVGEALSYSSKERNRPGMVTHTCNPGTLGGRGRQIT